ncbi:hypothetical protein MMC07_000420 [Pseudocyphellaria aurata]|nr:hypothetical protein [Pseudocyphellaria aurata]
MAALAVSPVCFIQQTVISLLVLEQRAATHIPAFGCTHEKEQKGKPGVTFDCGQCSNTGVSWGLQSAVPKMVAMQRMTGPPATETGICFWTAQHAALPEACKASHLLSGAHSSLCCEFTSQPDLHSWDIWCQPPEKGRPVRLLERSHAWHGMCAAACRIFTLARERDLDLDFHVDENGNPGARGLEYVAHKTLQHGYQGRVVCGHCW